MNNLKINFVKLAHCVQAPTYATSGSAGLDLSAAISTPVLLKVGERKLIPTGILVKIPADCEGQIRARSGLALEHGVTLLNGLGTIDSDYQGEVKALLINLGNLDVEIKPGQRIAQIVFAPIIRVELNEVAEIGDLPSVRNAGGFGSTGI